MATLNNLVDETTNIKNELKTCHTNLKNNLSSKGVTVSPSDKMGALCTKVGTIEVAKKVASGTISKFSYNKQDKTLETYTVNTNLTFVPSKIELYITKFKTNYGSTGVSNILLNSKYNNSPSNGISINQGTNCKLYITDISENSFIYNVSKGDIAYYSTSTDITWYAYE